MERKRTVKELQDWINVLQSAIDSLRDDIETDGRPYWRIYDIALEHMYEIVRLRKLIDEALYGLKETK